VLANTHLRPLDGAGLISEVDAVLAVYAAAMEPPREQLPGRRMMMERHARYPAFRGLAAVTEDDHPGGRGTIIGIGYGFRGQVGQWWHDMVTSAITAATGSRAAGAWMEDSFEIGELHVHPDYQGQGIGRRILLSLAAGRPERTAVLSTLDAASRARRLYRGVGFTDLLTGFRFPGGGERYAVMGAQLPLRPGLDRSG
jgi:ribosomal protein S18 acetylase RimI-like enzyme